MDRTEFITATALVLFGAFVLGWLASWLIGRITGGRHTDRDEMAQTAETLAKAERSRDEALATLAQRDARLATAEAELATAMEGLRESRTEIEELRDYIERKLVRR